WDAMTVEQLTAMMQGLGVAAAQCSAFLTHRLGNNAERAEVELRRAMDLPGRVLRRRAEEAKKIILADGTPNIPQHAAWIPVMLKEIQAHGARIERRQSGSSLQ